MKPRFHDPLRLDVAAFAADSAELAGHWPHAELTRLLESQMHTADGPPSPPGAAADAASGAVVAWRVRGELRPVVGGEAEIWLHIDATTPVALECQRCLQPVGEVLQVQRRIRFVRGNDAAEQLDAELEDDVLALTRALDLRALIEDELLLALPLVPRHVRCPQPLAAPAPDAAVAEPPSARPNPFAVLKSLKSGD